MTILCAPKRVFLLLNSTLHTVILMTIDLGIVVMHKVKFCSIYPPKRKKKSYVEEMEETIPTLMASSDQHQILPQNRLKPLNR